MPQKTNLNVSPYYDDFDKANNFYKVLFKPGQPVQARELTTLQSMLQNQVESFGSHIFKEGSMVVPGNINVDTDYHSVKIETWKHCSFKTCASGNRPRGKTEENPADSQRGSSHHRTCEKHYRLWGAGTDLRACGLIQGFF